MIRISINLTYPSFAALSGDDQKHIAVSLSTHLINSLRLNYQSYPLNTATVGDFAVNQRDYIVSMRRPLLFSRTAFTMFGNINEDSYLAAHMGHHVAALVEQGVIVVTDTDTMMDLTPADILTFTP